MLRQSVSNMFLLNKTMSCTGVKEVRTCAYLGPSLCVCCLCVRKREGNHQSAGFYSETLTSGALSVYSTTEMR